MDNTSSGNILSNFNNVPRLTKTIAIVLGVFLILGVIGNNYLLSFLTLNVANVAPPYFFLWTFITAGLTETSLIAGIFNIVFLIFIGKYLEPIWGSKEFIKFIGIVNFFSSLCSFFFFLFSYMFTGNVSRLYNVNVSGFSGVIIGFTIALKQLIPEQEFSVLFFKIRAKWLPSILVAFRLILSLLIFGFNDRSITLVLFGSLIAWIYLRFYQTKSGGIKGDLNEAFSFYTFFPEPIQPVIKQISNFVYKLLCKLNLCSSSTFSNQSILPITNDDTMEYSTPDMDRRRALAVKALEERMQQQQQQIFHEKDQHTQITSFSIIKD